MAKSQIIKEQSVERIKNFLFERIEYLDAEIVILDAEAKQEREHRRNENTLGNILARTVLRKAEREAYHNCLYEIQRNIVEIEL